MKTERFISIEQTNLLILVVRLVSVSGAVIWAIMPGLFIVNCNRIHLIFIYDLIIAVYTLFFIIRLFIPEGKNRACNFCLATFLFDEIVVAYFIYNTGGGNSPFYSGYFVVITIAAFVLGTKPAIITAIFGAATFTVSQEYYGLGLYNAIELLYRIIPFIIIAFPTGILSDMLANHMEKVNQLNETLQNKNAELEDSLRIIENMQKQLIEREKEKTILELTENVAHRLRNPIMSIGGMAEILDKKIDKMDNTKGLKKYTDYIKIESRKLSTLSDNLLQMSNSNIELKFTSIPQSVNRIINKFKERMKKYKIELETDIDINMPPIRIDENKLLTAVKNILENSIENMKNGGKLFVGVKIVNKNVEIKIADTGLGIPEDMLENIFKPFQSGGNVKKGIGIPIAKHSIEMIGGVLSVKSAVGKGTTFKITLPV